MSADDQGFFRATDLQVGTYEVRVEAAGFAPFVHTGISFDVGISVPHDPLDQHKRPGGDTY